MSRTISVWIFILLGIIASYVMREEIEDLLAPKTARERYLKKIRKGSLGESPLFSEWLRAGQVALQDSIFATLPFRAELSFDEQRPEALAYRFQLEKGSILELRLAPEPAANAVFGDLLQLTVDESAADKPVAAFSEDASTISYEIASSGTYLLRLQPELFVGGNFVLHAWLRSVLLFPVADKGNSAVQSFFGDPRDGGRRLHKGVDIFAPRGTPVLASVAGRISRVREGGLGGKTVWLRDDARGFNIYYAHLDTQWVRSGQKVNIGDTLGQVGNTGNARTTPPHLHYGVYQRGQGAFDPLPFIYQHPSEGKVTTADTSLLGKFLQVRRQNVPLRATPETKTPPLQLLSRDTFFRAIAAHRQFFHVRLPDGQVGYVLGKEVMKTVINSE